MSERWWAPGGSTDLLTPGTDAKADLGLFLLAAHRAGAQALVTLAKSEIPSERGIITALAETRAEIGPRLVDAIAAHLEPRYAGLLVCDVLDAADQGAVDVYRAMVSKGVAPPVAAERAAEAYGMPMRAMGLFSHHATDPKANPRVVSDAADRALMDYVSKMADAEAPAVAEVTKAQHPAEGTTLVRDVDFDRLHPRDAGGRFTETADEAPPTRQLSTLDRIRQRLGLLEVEPERVAEVVRTPTPTRRTQRAQRTQRVQRTRPKVEEAASTLRGQLVPTAMRTAMETQAITAKANIGTIEARAPKNAPPPRVLPDLLVPIDDKSGQTYYPLAQPIVIGVPMDESSNLLETSSNQAMTQKNPGRRIFRMGYLADRANYVEQIGKEQNRMHKGHAEVTINGHIHEWIEPHTEDISAEELRGNQDEAADHLKEKRRIEATRVITMPDGSLREQVDERELKYVKTLPVYKPYSPTGDIEPRDFVMVHYQDAGGERRAVPRVDEYVVEYDARGVEEGQTQSRAEHVEIELDPNQVYEVVPAQGRSYRRGGLIKAEIMYDKDNHVEVHRHYLRPLGEGEIDDVIEGIGKALDVLEARVFEQLHPRDQQGQFAAVADRPTLVSPAARPMRTQRVQRTKRMQRVQRVQRHQAPAEHAAPGALRSQLRSELKTSSMLTALAAPRGKASTAPGTPLPDMPMLTDTRHYKVLTEDELQQVLERMSPADFSRMHEGKTPLKLLSHERRAFSEHADLTVDAIPTMLAVNVGNEAEEQQRSHGVGRGKRPGRELLDVIRFHPGFELNSDNPEFAAEVAERVHKALDTWPNTDLIELTRDGNEILVLGSTVSGGHQNIIEYEKDIDLTGDIEITYLGKYRARDVMSQSKKGVVSLIGELGDLGDPFGPPVANPEVYRYRIATPKVRRYRADNV